MKIWGEKKTQKMFLDKNILKIDEWRRKLYDTDC